MNIINSLKNKIIKKNIPQQTTVNAENAGQENQRLNRQKLYEQWVCKDSWLLFNEGLPLLLGQEPGKIDEQSPELITELNELQEHARDCVQKKLFIIINIEADESEWQVKPVDLYRWAAVSRLDIPSEFSALMEFVLQTVKQLSSDTISESATPEEVIFNKHKEIVLGAAVSLIINAPERCKNRKGKIMANIIARQILEDSRQWFGEDEPRLSEAAATDLINHYINLAKPLIAV